MPLIPILTLIDGNRNEAYFDVSSLVIYVFVYFVCLATLHTFSAKWRYRNVLLSGTTAFFTVFICYHLISIPFQSLTIESKFFWTIVFQILSIIFVSAAILKLRKIVIVLVLAFIIVPAVSIAYNGANITFDFNGRTQAFQKFWFKAEVNFDSEATRVNHQSVNPNIYIFLFDGYQRSDILEYFYGFDNSPHLKKLAAMGFDTYVKSQSNFPKTTLSLNFMLSIFEGGTSIEKITEAVKQRDFYNLHSKNETPEAFSFLKNEGYEIWTMNYLGSSYTGCGINCLSATPWLLYEETQYLKMTPMFDWLQIYKSNFFLTLTKSLSNDNTKAYLKYLADNENPESGNLLFAHAIMPHPPYIVDENCIIKAGLQDFNLTELDYNNNNKDYLQQISCANKQMQTLASMIISKDPASIIIFASDHGWKVSHAIKSKIEQSVLSEEKLQNLFRFANFISIRDPSRCLRDTGDVFFLGDIIPSLIDCLGLTQNAPLLRNFGSYRLEKNTGNLKLVTMPKQEIWLP